MQHEQALKIVLAATTLAAAGAQAAPVTTALPASTDASQTVTLPGGAITFYNDAAMLSFGAELYASGSGGVEVSNVVSAGTVVDSHLSYTTFATIDKALFGINNVGTGLLLPFEDTAATTNGTATSYGFITFDASQNPDGNYSYKLDSVTYDASGAAVQTSPSPSAVPEPSSLSLLAAGALGLAAYRRRQRATRA